MNDAQHTPSELVGEMLKKETPSTIDSASSGSGASIVREDTSNRRRYWPELPGYEILGELGRGGMGIVYKARQTSLGRLVALKLVSIAGINSPEMKSRFRRAAEAIARLQHPNIVQIFEVGEADGQPFFSMEFVEGGDLASLIQEAPQSPPMYC